MNLGIPFPVDGGGWRRTAKHVSLSEMEATGLVGAQSLGSAGLEDVRLDASAASQSGGR